MRKHAQKLINSGLEYIARQQNKNGSFTSLSTTDSLNFSDAIERQTTFFTSTILSCLNGTREGSAKRTVHQKAVKFLLAEKSSCWSFNYWSSVAPEKIALPYPDDLDDTFAALIALYHYDKNIINGEVLACVAKLLTLTEVAEGGPYGTWILDRSNTSGNDVDSVANSNVAYFLSLHEIHLPNVEAQLGDVIKKKDIRSPYYPGFMQTAYFVSRGCPKAHRRQLVNSILRWCKKHHENMTPLEQAMGLSALISLEAERASIAAAANDLTKNIDGRSWRPYPFCMDPTRNNKPSYAGSSALTAAFCVEALSKYIALYDSEPHRISTNARTEDSANELSAFHKKIIAMAKADCKNSGEYLKTIAMQEIEKVRNEIITTLAFTFRKILPENSLPVSDTFVEQLSLANLYGWIAYDIYDDLLDSPLHDKSTSARLPAANFFARKLQKIYSTLANEQPALLPIFETLLNTIDNANAWEQAHCRRDAQQLPDFKDHQQLADRSIGHALGPLCILLSIGYKESSREHISMRSFFDHYLIARQLHDDAHDWAEDLALGRVNSVATQLFREIHTASKIESTAELQHWFWTTTIDRVVAMIFSHIDEARKQRTALGFQDGIYFMEKELCNLETIARETLAQRDDVLKFLLTFPLAVE